MAAALRLAAKKLFGRALERPFITAVKEVAPRISHGGTSSQPPATLLTKVRTLFRPKFFQHRSWPPLT
jgi:hypothetical protein